MTRPGITPGLAFFSLALAMIVGSIGAAEVVLRILKPGTLGLTWRQS